MPGSAVLVLALMHLFPGNMGLKSAMQQTLIGEQDLVFFHVPANFGNSIALTAGVGSGSKLGYKQVAQAAKKGWGEVNKMVKEGNPVWGPLNPDLQADSEIGCEMYYTPPKYWSQELVDKYIGNKTLFGLVRDPYDRVVALYKGIHGKVARGNDFVPDGRNCGKEVSKWAKELVVDLKTNPSKLWKNISCNMLVQAEFFDGKHGITLPLDLDTFPHSANKLLQEHGYDVDMKPQDLMHVTGCDDTWAGDLDDEARSMIREYFKRDFELRCSLLGHCDSNENICQKYTPGMCPDKLFAWDPEAEMYHAKAAL